MFSNDYSVHPSVIGRMLGCRS
ncbi:hypothetical protein [Okibacterium sp. HSC-33S16]